MVDEGNVETGLTTRVYSELQNAYHYFNRELFDGRLPECIVTLTHQRSSHGYFRSKPFVTRTQLEETDEFLAAMEEGADESEALERARPGIDEVSLNVFGFRDRTRDEILSTLVHEMTHLEQHHFGKPPKRPSHNREWGDMMKKVGLYPSATGAPGGKETGRRVAHYAIPDGPFEMAVGDCPATLDWVGLLTRKRKKSKRAKAKYECAACEVVLRGKPGISVVCGLCEEPMTEELIGGPPSEAEGEE